MNDATDLAAWTKHRDEAAFARLVERHAAMVRGICRRRLGDSHAEESVQAVFIILAERAGSVANPNGLGAWLHGVAIRVCIQARRSMARRANHERQAADLQRQDAEPEPDVELAWADLRPHLDEAIAALSTSQREAVIGHFLEGLPQAAVAARLGISEDAAHQRIHYALGKLRAWFGKRGMAVGAGVLAVGLASEAGAAEPALVSACTQAAVHPVATSAASVLAGSALAAGAAKVAATITLAALAMAAGGVVAWRALTPSSMTAPIRPAPAPVVAAPPIVLARAESILLAEDFEDASFAQRGWYDNPGIIRSFANGSQAAELRFLPDASEPVSRGCHRHLFSPVTSVRIAYAIRFGPGWEEAESTGRMGYLMVLTDHDDRFAALSQTHLTCTVGVDKGTPFLSLQDPLNLDVGHLGQNLSRLTEDRAVAGGNGAGDRHGPGLWFISPDGRAANLKQFVPEAGMDVWRGGRVGPWHRIEIGLRLNSVVAGTGVADGQLSYRIDGRTVLAFDDVLLRTGRNADMRFNQLVISPWIARAQAASVFWIDDLQVSTDIP